MKCCIKLEAYYLKKNVFLFTCAAMSQLPSIINTMAYTTMRRGRKEGNEKIKSEIKLHGIISMTKKEWIFGFMNGFSRCCSLREAAKKFFRQRPGH